MKKLILVAMVVLASCAPKAASVTVEAIEAKEAELETFVEQITADGVEPTEEQIAQYETMSGELQKMAGEFIDANLDNEAGAGLFIELATTGGGKIVAQTEMFDVFDKFSPEMQALPAMVKFRESMDAQKAFEAKFGGKYIEIVSTAPDGAQVRLSEVVAANKLTLIDFWASWCGPCMRELPHLKEAYSEYHDRGFEIFGVSLDDDRAAWEAAIKDNEMGWVHVGTVQGWAEPAAVEYGVRSIPASWLVDGEGNIVARNLRGEELKKKVAGILK